MRRKHRPAWQADGWCASFVYGHMGLNPGHETVEHSSRWDPSSTASSKAAEATGNKLGAPQPHAQHFADESQNIRQPLPALSPL